MSRRIVSRPALLTGLTLAIAACHQAPKPPTTITVTQATLDSLPRYAAVEGRRLCEADGRVSCPLESAVANWLADDHFAVWEPGRPIMTWRAGDTTATELGATDGDLGGSIIALAVARDGSGYQVLTTGAAERLLHFSGAGKLGKTTVLPMVGGYFVRGFAGNIPVMERLRGAPGDRRARFELDRLRSAEDTLGTPVLRETLGWLNMAGARPEAPPFFPPWPTFAFDPDGGMVWSPGEHFLLHRLDADGRERWTVTGDLAGEPASDSDLAFRRAQLLAPGSLNALDTAQVDSIAARSSHRFPAISGLIMSRHGDMLISGPVIGSRDSVECYRMNAEGKLTGRFRVARRVHLLLYAGDSVLVHQPTPGEPWEVRWLQLKPAH